MASGTISAMNTGETITIAGLCIQLIFFTVFIVTSLHFHRRLGRQKTSKALQMEESREGDVRFFRSWESVLWGLYISSALILVRSIFRLIEYVQGNDGYLISHEVFLYIFDTVLMFFAMVAMNVFHPSIILVGESRHGRVESSRSNSHVQLRSVG